MRFNLVVIGLLAIDPINGTACTEKNIGIFYMTKISAKNYSNKSIV